MSQNSNTDWLQQLVLVASSLSSHVQEQGTTSLVSPSGKTYRVHGLLSQNPVYRTRLLESQDGGRVCVLKVAQKESTNSVINYEASLLEILWKSDSEAGTQAQTRPFFPELVENFNGGPEQGNRAISILGFPDQIVQFDQLKSAYSFVKEGVRIDAKTAAWFLGKAFKVVAYTHLLEMVNQNVTIGNLLLVPEMHGLVLFDWTSARLSNDMGLRRRDIQMAVQSTLHLMGGDVNTGKLRYPDESLGDRGVRLFENFFSEILSGRFSFTSTYEIKDRWYEDIVWNLWRKDEFHPFTTFAR